MSDIKLRYTDSIPLPPKDMRAFVTFLQGVVDRGQVGNLRYGAADRRKKYLTRLKKELAAYEKTGNMEQLFNIAVYCFLESHAPENKKFHFDPLVKSVTRVGRLT